MGSFINDINDVEEQQPTRNAHCHSLGDTAYKIPDGKPPNVFGLDERFGQGHAVEVIQDFHLAWRSSCRERRTLVPGTDHKVADLVHICRNSLFTLSAWMSILRGMAEISEKESGAVFF
jgi:inorganic pyrophosphatase